MSELITENSDNGSTEQCNDSSTRRDTINKVVNSFRVRAERARQHSYIIILGMLLVFCVSPIFGYMYSLRDEWLLDQEFNKLNNELVIVFASTKASADQAELVSKSYLEKIEKVETQNSELKQQLKMLSEALRDTSSAVNHQSMTMDRMSQSINNLPGNIKIILDSRIASSITVRAGLIILVIFGIQIGLSFYRYNAKLAVFYESRADALEIMQDSEELTLEQIVEFVSPRKLEFALPKSPIDHISGMISNYTSTEKEANTVTAVTSNQGNKQE